MKRFFIAVFLTVMLLAGTCLATDGVENIYVKKIWSSESIAASGTDTIDAIDLSYLKATGFFSLQYTVTGAGTCKFEYLLSNDGVTYVTPSTASDIATGVTAGSDLISFSPEVAKYMKIKVTETGTSNAVVVTAWIAIQ